MALEVNQLSDDAKRMQKALNKVAALCNGTEAMRDAGELYLPKWPLERFSAYQFRLKNSTLFNGYNRTIENLSAKPFQEDISYNDFPDGWEEWAENIDLAGNNGQVFAHKLFKSALRDGIAHILVDYPVTTANDGTPLMQTLAQEKAAGVRPYWIQIEQMAVLGWRSENVDGYERLTQFRYMETIDVDDGGGFGTIKTQQVRVLYPGRWEKWQLRKTGEGVRESWKVVEEGVTTLDFIPLVTLYTNRTGYMTASPPLEDLADLNIKHWQSQSDQDSLLHTARVPLLVRIGVPDSDEQTATAIGKSITDLPIGADMKYVEHTGAAINAGRDALKDLEDQMEAMGAELLIQDTGANTATEAAIDSQAANTRLNQMVDALEDALDNAFATMGAWVGVDYGGNVQVFDDFASIAVNSQTIQYFVTALVTLVNSGLLSQQSAFDEMKRYGILNADLLWEEEQARIANEAPTLTGQPMALTEQDDDAPLPGGQSDGSTGNVQPLVTDPAANEADAT